MKNLVILLIAIVMTGCSNGDNNSKTAEKKPAPAPSTTKAIIEGLTGKTAVDQGQKAKEKIRQISAEQNKQINEVLDDK